LNNEEKDGTDEVVLVLLGGGLFTWLNKSEDDFDWVRGDGGGGGCGCKLFKLTLEVDI
jgi:hypothetical protein